MVCSWCSIRFKGNAIYHHESKTCEFIPNPIRDGTCSVRDLVEKLKRVVIVRIPIRLENKTVVRKTISSINFAEEVVRDNSNYNMIVDDDHNHLFHYYKESIWSLDQNVVVFRLPLLQEQKVEDYLLCTNWGLNKEIKITYIVLSEVKNIVTEQSDPDYEYFNLSAERIEFAREQKQKMETHNKAKYGYEDLTEEQHFAIEYLRDKTRIMTGLQSKLNDNRDSFVHHNTVDTIIFDFCRIIGFPIEKSFVPVIQNKHCVFLTGTKSGTVNGSESDGENYFEKPSFNPERFYTIKRLLGCPLVTKCCLHQTTKTKRKHNLLTTTESWGLDHWYRYGDRERQKRKRSMKGKDALRRCRYCQKEYAGNKFYNHQHHCEYRYSFHKYRDPKYFVVLVTFGQIASKKAQIFGHAFGSYITNQLEGIVTTFEYESLDDLPKVQEDIGNCECFRSIERRYARKNFDLWITLKGRVAVYCFFDLADLKPEHLPLLRNFASPPVVKDEDIHSIFYCIQDNTDDPALSKEKSDNLVNYLTNDKTLFSFETNLSDYIHMIPFMIDVSVYFNRENRERHIRFNTMYERTVMNEFQVSFLCD
jgi:hypothetical protein